MDPQEEPPGPLLRTWGQVAVGGTVVVREQPMDRPTEERPEASEAVRRRDLKHQASQMGFQHHVEQHRNHSAEVVEEK